MPLRQAWSSSPVTCPIPSVPKWSHPLSRDWGENTLAPTQCCHVVTDHKPEPLPPCCFALGTCVFCFYFIGSLVKLQKASWPPFIQRGKTSNHLSFHDLLGLPTAGKGSFKISGPSRWLRISSKYQHTIHWGEKDILHGHRQGGNWQKAILREGSVVSPLSSSQAFTEWLCPTFWGLEVMVTSQGKIPFSHEAFI